MTDQEPKPILRKPPSGVTLWFLKAPKYLYRIGLGWILGNRFVMIEHTGRRSGNTYHTVLEVIRNDDTTIDIAAAWGPKTDWLRNIEANPRVRVSMGRLRNKPATAAIADDATAAETFAAYTKAHPRSARALSKSLGLPLDDPETMAASMPPASRMRVIAWYEVAIGVLVLAWWGAALAGGDVEEVRSGSGEIWFHIAAETTMAVLLIAGGRLVLRGSTGLGVFVSGVGLGTLLYSTINAAGHFAGLEEWAAVVIFGVLTASTIAAIVGLALTFETATDRAVDRLIDQLTPS